MKGFITRMIVFIILSKCGESNENGAEDGLGYGLSCSPKPAQEQICSNFVSSSTPDCYKAHRLPGNTASHLVKRLRFLRLVIQKPGEREVSLFESLQPGLKKTSSDNKQMDMMRKRQNTGLANLFELAKPVPCSCETDYHLFDLGHSYFPRYLPTAECQPPSYWNPPYNCREKHYKVQVLRKRRTDNGVELEPIDYTVPDGLRKHWVLETQTVTVACECVL